MNTRYLCGVVSLLMFHSLHPFPSALAQGNLTPSGPPAPTMKTLDQVEPRTPVDATRTPGNFLAQFIINRPGSYYLTTNLVGVSDKRGIQIEASNVTLDLNGFSMLGHSNSLDGIYFPFLTITNATIRNGTISGWNGNGIYYLGTSGTFEKLNVTDNIHGLRVGDGSQVKGCTVSRNLNLGINVSGSGCVIAENNCVGNNAGNNSSGAGISVFGSRNRIEGNHVTSSATAGYGINTSSSSNNIVVRNSVQTGVTNYFFNNNQFLGPLITNSTSGIITNSNPWANFSF